MSTLLVEHFSMAKGVLGNVAGILEFWFLHVLGTCESEFGSAGSVFLLLFFQTIAQGKIYKALIPASNLLVAGRKQKQMVGGMRRDLLKLIATPRDWPQVDLFGQRILDVAHRHRGDGATQSVGGWEKRVWEARAGAGAAGTLHLEELLAAHLNS
jgi:hypothetical protein